jgi:prepilin-type processing-associated H-X9-DG protein
MSLGPKVLYCCTDPPGKLVKVDWMEFNARRTYTMVAAGQSWGSYVQVPAAGPPRYPLPNPIRMGVGIYWSGAPAVDWDAPSYKTSVVKDPSGAFILVEAPQSFGCAGNEWCCVCIGPTGTGGWSGMYQIDYHPTNPKVSNVSEGSFTYKAHGSRFNYLFYDNHVEALGITQTIGTGTTNTPLGMWTIYQND